jgi:hypothetical protein
MKRLQLVCLLALAPAATWANIIPTGTTITGAGPYTWAYDFQLSSDQNAEHGLQPGENPVSHTTITFGSFLTIFDFGGYVVGSCTGPAGWTCTAQNVGFTPDDVTPVDKSWITNLTWTYTSGPTILGQPDGKDLGIFTAKSIYGEPTLVSYAARAVKNTGFSSGTIADNVGNTQGPIPEPASLALAGVALVLLGLSQRGKAAQ